MQSTPSDPSMVRFSVSLYQLLLRAYPSGFRREYGSLMAQVFRDSCLRAARGSPGGLLAGGGLLLLFAWLASSRPEYNPYNAGLWPIDRFLDQARTPSSIAGILFTALGLVGLTTRYSQPAGGLGRAGLWTSLVGSVLTAVGLVGQSMTDTSPWWQITMLGMTALYAGLALFGVACLKRKVFPRWNALPLVAALPWLIAIFTELVAALMRLPYDLPEAVVAVMFMITFSGLMLIGYRLQADTAMTNYVM